MQDMTRTRLLVYVAIIICAIGLSLVAGMMIGESRQSDKQLHYEIALRSHTLTWEYGTARTDSVYQAGKKAFQTWIDSIDNEAR